MTVILKPVSCVLCPVNEKYTPTLNCIECERVIEVRRPWRYYAVKCKE